MSFFHRRLFRPADWKESTEPLANPWRGLYSIYRVDAATDVMPQLELPFWQCTPTAGEQLALLEINLKAYRDSELPSEALDRIDRVLTCFSGWGMGLICRFLYDWDGQGTQGEPYFLSQVISHIGQLEQILHRHTQSVFVLQGLLIGSWGEMHGTRFSTPRDMDLLARAMEQAAGEQTFLAVRCPNFWRSIHRSFGPLEDAEAYSGSGKARMGLFDDAILASDTDLGTYGSTSQEVATDPRTKYLPQEELRFQNQLCRFVPNGGEVVNASHQNAFPQVLDTLQMMRITYLNSSYDPAVLAQWRSSMIRRRGSPWNGCSGLDYIAAHLGYRYLVQKVTATQKRGEPGKTMLELTLVNSGFAPCYRPVAVSLCLHQGEMVRSYPIETDVRKWEPQVPVTFRLCLTGVTGDWQLGLRMMAEDGRELRLANVPSDGSITNLLGGLYL